MTTSLRLRLHWLLRLWILLVAATFTSTGSFAYNAENQTTVAYDIGGESAVGYDSVSVLATGEKKIGSTGNRATFSKFADLVAAKGGVQTAEGLATQPNRIYSARELIRRAEEPGPFHNFPESFNQEIFGQGTRTVTANYFMCLGLA